MNRPFKYRPMIHASAALLFWAGCSPFAAELDNPQAYISRGAALAQQGRLDLAEADFNRALHMDPQNAQAYNNLGLVYSARDDFDKAIEYFSRSIELNPNLAEPYFGRGFAHRAKGELTADKAEYEKALNDYSNAIKIIPSFGSAYYNRAVVHYMMNNFDAAWSDLHSAETHGRRADPSFVSALREASGRTN